MQNALETFLASGVIAFMLTFMRMGTAIMIMPGLGDSFVSGRIRLLMALGVTFALFPVVMPFMPTPVPPLYALIILIGSEFLIGLLIGTVARIFMVALDTAGMIVSMQSGLSNAQVFNPSLAMQGSLMGAFLSVTGILFLFATNMHHLLITGLVESYSYFPVGQTPDSGSMAELIAMAIARSFETGVKMALPFIIMTLVIYVGMGVLSRLMPQVQVFILAVPIQILLSLLTFSLALTAMLYYWIGQFEDGMIYFLRNAGG